MSTISVEDFYAQLLSLPEPWKVVSVKLSSDQKRVDVALGHDVGSLFPCPKCGKPCSVYDHSRPRRWRHLGTLQAQTYVHAQVPRTRCTEHGALQIEVAWAVPFAQTTLWMEIRVLETLKECDVQATARLQELSWSSCQEADRSPHLSDDTKELPTPGMLREELREAKQKWSGALGRPVHQGLEVEQALTKQRVSAVLDSVDLELTIFADGLASSPQQSQQSHGQGADHQQTVAALGIVNVCLRKTQA